MRLPVLIAPLVMAVSAPATAQAATPFLIFFDWGKPELTKDAQSVLDTALENYRKGQPQRIEIGAHTDRSGPSAVNLVASRRRGQAVREYLTVHGVPASAITLTAFGESRPIVPTEDGVREMQNRRVEISFSPAN